MNSIFLKPEDDGLAMRRSSDHTRLKLAALRCYIRMLTTAMRNKWSVLTYTDLLAGPGKDSFQVDEAKPIKNELGSPLIALTADFPFTHYWFVEKDCKNYEALKKRVSMSQFASRAKVIHGDCNVIVDDIVAEIMAQRDSLNLAFLDPEGLELPWATIEKLAKIKRMDLIILFSTSGFLRNVGNYIESNNLTKLDMLFGGTAWRDEYARERGQFDRHRMVEYYKSLFTPYGYQFKELSVRNSRNAEVYRLIGGGKHQLAVRFWVEAINGAQKEIYGPQTLKLPFRED